MKTFSLSFLLAALGVLSAASAETLIRFERRVLETKFYAEGAAYGDIDGDGNNDIVYGPFWFAGPGFTKRHTYYEPKEFGINGYSDNFFAYVRDMNGDGLADILILGFPGKEARLYLHPGKDKITQLWPMFVITDVVDNESPEFTDLTGDGKPEIVCSKSGQFGYYEPDWKEVTKPWAWHPVTENVNVGKFTHGLGIGDVNGDGKLDLLEAKRWWEHTTSGTWKPHALAGIGGGAQMFAYDFNGDGHNDIVSSLQAHGFGVAWFENKDAGWNKHLIVGQEPWENEYGVRFSQPHAMALADVDGDGIADIITGKRYWAHNGHDPNERDPRVLYWFQTKREKDKVSFIPHLIDDDTGVGTQLTVGDIDGDGLLDVVVGNKYGCRVLLQRREEVSAERYAQFQPEKLYGPDHIAPKDYKAGQKPEEAASHMILPPGFKAEVIASEPDIVQPIAMCFDERGRLWVAEGNSYPQKRAGEKGPDRIVILEDIKGTGKFDKRTVFVDGLNLVSGIEVGFGGVWVGAAPQLLFIPKDADDRAGKPQVLLDGWGFQDTHETLNSFLWGPDGWLYGCHGVFTHSLVGKPDAPAAERIPINAGVWRYHPVRHVFEVFAQGTSNPWGLDYNDKGEFFITACVIPHLYHILPGARYQRQAGQHFNPYTYDDIKTIADHAHFAGVVADNAHWGDRKKKTEVPVANDTDQAGGGHAHCGLCIYQGDNFPAEYRGELLFSNLHGHRLVHDHVDPKGSGYTGQHRADFLRSDDHWFIGIAQKVGPDGALYMSDWSDKQVCHQGSNAVDMWDRSNGRIYRITYDTLKPKKVDLSKLSDEELAKITMEDANEYFVRQARKVLMERSASGRKLTDQARERLNAKRTLRSLWALFSAGALDDAGLLAFLGSEDESVRAWSIRLLSEVPGEASARLAREDKSQVVRRELASSLQRLPLDKRAGIAAALISHKEDAEDQNIQLLIWYGIEPVVAADVQAGMKLAATSKMDKITRFIYRRLSSDDAGRAALLQAAANEPDPVQREKTLAMLLGNTRGAGKLALPGNWPALSVKFREGASPAVADLVEELTALSGEDAAVKKFRDTLAKSDAPAPARERALGILLQARDQATAGTLQTLIQTTPQPTPLRRKAIQALASMPDNKTAGILIERFVKFSSEEKVDAVSTLASTPKGGAALLQAVIAKQAGPEVLSPFIVRQLQSLQNKEVSNLMEKAIGTINKPKADLPQQKAKYRALLSPEKLKGADIAAGKLLFTGSCGACHRLMGDGATVGPDLTGSNRGNLDYLLDNVLDPNAVIGKAYQLNLFSMKDGRVMSGLVKEESDVIYCIVLPGGLEFTLNKPEVTKREVAKVSLMPEGMFDALAPAQLVDLVAYLQKGAAIGANLPASKVDGAMEGEELKVLSVTGGRTRLQAMSAFRASRWSGDAQLWWTGSKVGDVLTLALLVPEQGSYSLKAVLTKARDYGIFAISLDGKRVTESLLDLYNSPDVISSGELDWGTYALDAGEHKLEIKATGRNPAALPALMFGLDYVKLEKK